jgi:hypothetical protein
MSILDVHGNIRMSLHGRNVEIKLVIDFVISRPKELVKVGKTFNNKSKLVFVSGSHGIGKSEFINALGSEIMLYEDPENSNYAYKVYKYRCIKTYSTKIFSVWRKLIFDILNTPSTTTISTIDNELLENDLKYYTNKEGIMSSINMNNFVFQYLIHNNFGDHLSLLNRDIFEAIVFEEKECLNNLCGDKREEIKLNLFFTIIQCYATTISKILVFLM